MSVSRVVRAMLLLAVRTRPSEVRRRERAPALGIPRRTQTVVPVSAACDSSIMPSPFAQQGADTGCNVAYSGTQDIFDTHLVILIHLVQGWNVITPWIVLLTWTSSFQPSASVPTFGLRACHALGHTVSIRAPITTHMRAGVVGVLHAVAILPFTWRPVGTKTGDRVVLIPALEATSG